MKSRFLHPLLVTVSTLALGAGLYSCASQPEVAPDEPGAQ